MSHPDEGTIQMLLDGELGPDERARVEAHARSCPACAAGIKEARAFMAEADRLVSMLAVPARVETPTTVRGRAPALRALAWAASIVLAVGLGYYGRGATAPQPAERLASDRQAQASPAVSGQAVAPKENTNVPSAASVTTPPRRGAEVPPSAEKPELDARTSRAAEAKQAVAAAPPPAAPNAAMEREDRASRDAAAPAANAVAAKTAAEPPSELAAAGGRAEPVSGWRVIALEEAVRILGGQIRLIDGLSPERVETGPGTAVAGADPAAPVVRVVYTSGAIILDEQREGKAQSAGRLEAARAPEQAAVPTVGWRQAGSIRFAVTGSVSPDSLTALAGRVR